MGIFTPSFTPLPEVQSDIVQMNLPLPNWISPEQIGVDVSMLELMCQIAGIERLIITMTNEQIASVIPVIDKTNTDGTSTSSGGAAKVESKTYESKKIIIVSNSPKQ